MIQMLCVRLLNFVIDIRTKEFFFFFFFRTNHGKGRAWVRLALMQKKLAEYIMIMVESKELLR